MKLAYYWMEQENADLALVRGTLADQEPVGRINALDVRELRVTDGRQQPRSKDTGLQA